MKSTILGAVIWLLFLTINTRAQLPIDGVHYPVGLAGIKGGSLPDSGIYFRDDNLFYYGTSDYVPDFKEFVYLQAPQLMWITDVKILGANYGMDVMVPVIYKYTGFNKITSMPGAQTATSSVETQRAGLGDIKIEPLLLSWHLQHFDFTAAYAVWAPTGSYHTNQNEMNLGDGMWTHMITLGGVWYIDPARSWAVSFLNHYELNSQIPGGYALTLPSSAVVLLPQNLQCSTYDVEWGVSKTIGRKTDVGIVGYYQQQFIDLNQPITPFSNPKVAGVGPEIDSEIEPWGLSFSLRYEYEFFTDNRPRGHTVDLTITKRF